MARAQQNTSSRRTPGVGTGPPAAAGAPPTADVAALAYELWQKSGCAPGRDQEFWFQAERELRAAQAAR